MLKKLKNDVIDSVRQKSFLDRFMEEFLKEEKEYDFTSFKKFNVLLEKKFGREL